MRLPADRTPRGELELVERSQLIEDIRAADRICPTSTRVSAARGEVVAAQRGTRYRRDGTVAETYERLEFRTL